MLGKKRVIKWTIVFFVVVIVCTFFSKSIYYFTLPKISVETPRPGTFSEVANLSQGSLIIKDAVSRSLELPAPIEIVDIFVRRGQTVSAGDQILKFSTGDIKKQMSSLEKQRVNAEIALLEFLKGYYSRITALRQQIPAGAEDGFVDVRSTSNGIVTDINVRVGDRVAAGSKLCEISDDSKFILQLPFLSTYDIKVGMRAEVSVPVAMTTLGGTVMEIGGQVSLHGSKARMVTIVADNPGNIKAGDSATCTIEGGMTPMEDGRLEYISTSFVYAETAGYISDINISLNEYVTSGKVMMRISVSDSGSAKDELDYMLSTGIYNGKTERQLRDALEEIETAIEQLALYAETGVVTAEADGVITYLPIQKNLKFTAGTLYEYAPENLKYEVVFTSGDIMDVEEKLMCTISYSIGGRQYKANGTIIDVGFGYVVAELSKLDERVLQAQSFSAEVALTEKNATLTIPTSAIVSSSHVYVVTPKETMLGKQFYASRQEVTTGLKDAYRVEITGGISPNDKVIVAWDREIADGDVVDIISELKS